MGRKRKDQLDSEYTDTDSQEQNSWKRYINQFDFGESFISITLGFLVIIVAGLLVFNYFSKRNQMASQIANNGASVTAAPTHPTAPTAPDAPTVPAATTVPTITKAQVNTSPTLTNTPSITIMPSKVQSSMTPIPSKVAQVTTKPTSVPTVVPSVSPIQQQPTEGTYIVTTNDTLWNIAEKQYGSGYRWTEIAKANNLQNPGVLIVGQKLTMPKLTAQAGEKGEDPTVSSSSTVKQTTYTVVKGDNLWKISVKVYGDGYGWTQIARANNLSHPAVIHPGNILTIPEYTRLK